jgi:hypothetical protein
MFQMKVVDVKQIYSTFYDMYQFLYDETLLTFIFM